MEVVYIHTKKFSSEAYTLSADIVGQNKSGWFVSGNICDDYYVWVNDFEAHHPVYGCVRGNFEDKVEASSQAAFDHFVKHHAPQEWDYWDI